MPAPGVLAPLTSVTTVRRGVFCVMGGLLLGTYLLLVAGFVQMYADPAIPAPAVTVLAAVTGVIALTPPFLVPIRSLEIVAARALLAADLPDPVERPSGSSRARGALWYLAHVVLGGAATLALVTFVPVGVVVLLRPLTSAPLLGTGVGAALVSLPPVPAVAAGVLLLVAPAYVFALAGAGLRRLAAVLLGPSATERIALLEDQRRDLAARNRLARELHDSVGHTLTVTTLQAAAAARALDRDPEFARTALAAIEETGRAAAADLDRVLGLLREGDAGSTDREVARSPARTLPAVPDLVEEARRTGRTVDLSMPTTTTTDLPPVLSREAFAVVREGLTNALRHGTDPVTVRITHDGAELAIDVGNAVAGGSGEHPTGGRGLAGLRERVDLLGGRMEAGPVADRWRLTVHLPLTRADRERR